MSTSVYEGIFPGIWYQCLKQSSHTGLLNGLIWTLLVIQLHVKPITGPKVSHELSGKTIIDPPSQVTIGIFWLPQPCGPDVEHRVQDDLSDHITFPFSIWIQSLCFFTRLWLFAAGLGVKRFLNGSCAMSSTAKLTMKLLLRWGHKVDDWILSECLRLFLWHLCSVPLSTWVSLNLQLLLFSWARFVYVWHLCWTDQHCW